MSENWIGKLEASVRPAVLDKYTGSDIGAMNDTSF